MRHISVGVMIYSTPEYDPWIFTEEEVKNSPSRMSGVSEEIENSVLMKSARFILEIGTDMDIPSLTISVAITFYQRFYMLESILAHSPPLIASACLFLSCKVQETHKRLKDIIHSSVKMRTKGSVDYPDGLELYEDSPGYYEEKMQLLDKEREILKVLNFDLSVEHPYKAVWVLSRQFLGEVPDDKQVVQAAWNFLNDSYETYVHVRFDANEIASAAFFLSAKLHGYDLPNGREHNENGERIRGWHELYHCSVANVTTIANRLMDLYELKSERAKLLAIEQAAVRESESEAKPESEPEPVAERETERGRESEKDSDI